MEINEEYVFTYEDYLEIINSLEIGVAEAGEKYEANEEVNDKTKENKEHKIHQKHDKSFKEALSEPEEMEFLLKEFVGIEEKKETLQEYKNEFITKQYEKRQADIIYKNTEKEIYYIVEHQSSKDMEMPQRIAEYCLELMRDVTKDKMQAKEIYPTIVPIVLYTGLGKWDVETNFAERQKNSIGSYEAYKVDIKYTVIDINKIENEKLLEKQDYLTNIMLLEKCKTVTEGIEMLKKICCNMKKKEQIEKIVNYYSNMYKQMLKAEERKELEKILEGSDDKMTALEINLRKEREEIIRKSRIEGIEKGIQQGLEQGVEQARIDVAKKLLKIKMPIEQIIEITGLSKEEIEKLK